MKSNMMRLVSWLLVIAMLAAMPVTALAASDGWHDCDGDPSTDTMKVVEHHDPTCYNEGYDVRKCTACGYTESHVNVQPAHHTFDTSAGTLAKCYYEAKDGKAGYWLIPCTKCDTKMKVIDHNNVGATDKTNYLGAGHYLEDNVTAATCLSDGYNIQKCTSDGCGLVLTPVKFGDMTGHDWIRDEGGNEWKVIKNATATTKGLKQRTCKVCGATDTMPIPVTTPTENYATVSKDKISIYNSASESASAVAVALKGSRFEIVSKSGDGQWYQISNGAVLGWIRSTSAVQNAAANSISASPYAKALKYATITSASDLRVRAGASADSAILSSISFNTNVFVYEVSGNWFRISRDEQRWIDSTEGVATLDVKLGLGTDVNAPGYTPPETIKPTTPSASDTVIATGTVNSTTPLNVRKNAEISILNLLGSLANGTKVDIYETTNVNGHQWGRIKYKSGDGWICLDYVTIKSGSTDTNTDSTVSAAPNATIANCATAVNVRKNPEVKVDNLIGTIPVRTRVAITKEENGWYYVENKGWISGQYVTLDKGVLEMLKGGSNGQTPLTRYTAVSVPAIVKTDTVLRATAAATGTELLKVYADPDVTLTVTDRTLNAGTVWCKLTIGGFTGWINGNDLTLPEVTGIVSVDSAKVFTEKNVDGAVATILGKNTRVVIAEQSTDGTYIWGKIKGTSNFIQMHNLSTIVDASDVPGNSATVSISAKVGASGVDLMKTASASGTKLLTLAKDTTVTITEMKTEGSIHWGKVTVGAYSGWIDLDDVTQDTITGTVTADSVNLYSAPSTSGGVEKILRKGQKITVLERVGVDNNIWGKVRMDGKNYWGNLSGVTLAGQTAPTTPTTPTTSTTPETPSTPTASQSAAGTIVCAKSVNVRQAAGVGNNLVTTLANGTSVTVYEQTTVDGARWGRIDQGWVAMEYVDLSTRPAGSAGNTTTGGTILSTVPSGSVAVGFVNTADLTVRSGAGQGYAKVTTLKKGTNVVIHEQQLTGGMIWGRIDQGWICTSYVTLTGTAVTGSGTSGVIKGCFYTANIRSNPGVGNALVGKIMVNSPVEIYEQKEYSGETWGRTSVGWIAMQYVLIGSVPVV